MACDTGDMPKRLKKPHPDPNVAARNVVAAVTNEETIPTGALSRYMSRLGRKGGLASGAKRMSNLSAATRSEIALRAATARWERERAKKKAAKKR